jgi:hypothetical protein
VLGISKQKALHWSQSELDESSFFGSVAGGRQFAEQAQKIYNCCKKWGKSTARFYLIVSKTNRRPALSLCLRLCVDPGNFHFTDN